MTDHRYSFRTVWSEEDHEWVAFSPEFEGVSGLGKDPETAIREAQVALDATIEAYSEEGWPLPKPQELLEHSGQFRLRLSKSLHARLVQLAEDEGVSLNALAANLIAEGIGAATTAGVVARRISQCVSVVESAVLNVPTDVGVVVVNSNYDQPPEFLFDPTGSGTLLGAGSVAQASVLAKREVSKWPN